MIFLDTSVCIDILRGNTVLADLLDQYEEEFFGITILSVFELELGLYRAQLQKQPLSKQILTKYEADLNELLGQLVQFSLEENSARQSAQIYAKLKRNGLESQPFDCLIAGVIFANGFNEIITGNPAHFRNIENLIVHEYSP